MQLPEALPQWLAEYAGVCVTLGQDVQILRAGETRLAHAIGIDEAGKISLSIKRAQEQQQAAKLVHGEVVVLVVGVDDRVERLDGGECLHDLVGRAAKVGADLV